MYQSHRHPLSNGNRLENPPNPVRRGHPSSAPLGPYNARLADRLVFGNVSQWLRQALESYLKKAF